MSSMNTKALGAAAGVGVAVVAWLGASIYGGSASEQALRAFAARPSAETGLKISNLQHAGGLLSSSGSFAVQLVRRCSDSPATMDPVQVQYSLAHLILPTSVLRIEWNAQPTGELAADLASLFGPGIKLEGKGGVSFGGEIHSAMALPELTVDRDGSRLSISPSSGRVALGKTAFALNWGIDKLVTRGSGNALELNKIALDVDLKNRYLGTGNTALTVDKIATSLGTAEGFRHATSVSESGERITANISESLRSGVFADKTVKDLALEIAVKDLDKASIETISHVFEDTCGLQNATAEEGERFSKALRTLLVQGFSFGIPKLAGSVGNGSIDGKLMVVARKAADANAPIALAKMLSANGELSLKGDALSADQKQMAVQMGAAQELEGALKASFEYADGMLRANGRVFDAGTVDNTLRGADQTLNAFFASTRLAAAKAPMAAPAEPVAPAEPAAPAAPAEAPVAVPAAPAVAPAAPPAPVAAPAALAPAAAPAAPATAECGNVKACLAQTLKAAAREDVDTVRSLATRIDSFGKPDLGNRAVSRKLNSQGLEALKADQPAAAADLFRKGLAENPRDVELAGNLGFALVKADKPQEAVEVLSNALQLDPRRSSTWTPLAEALALAGRKEESQAALWVAFQWSGNRDKSLAFYGERSEKEAATRPAVAELYSTVRAWVSEGRKPKFMALAG